MCTYIRRYHMLFLCSAWLYIFFILGLHSVPSTLFYHYISGCSTQDDGRVFALQQRGLRFEPLSNDTKHEVYTDLLHTVFCVNYVVANFSAEANFFLRKRSHFHKNKFASTDIIVCLSKYTSLRIQNTDFALSNYIVCGIKLKVCLSKEKSLRKQSLFLRR